MTWTSASDMVYHIQCHWQTQCNRNLTLAGLKARADTFSAAMVACSKALGRNGRMYNIYCIDIYVYMHHVIIYYVCVSPPRINADLDLKKGWGLIYSTLKWCWPSQQNLKPWCVWIASHFIASHLLLQSHQDQKLCPNWRGTPHMSSLGGMVLCFLVVPGHFLWAKMFNGSFTINIIRWKKSIVMEPQAMGWSSRNSIGTSPTSYRRWNPSLHVK